MEAHEDIIQIRDQFYVLATSSLADQRIRVLRQGSNLALFDIFGDILPTGQGTHGLYQDNTRFLSKFEFRLGTDRPLFLNSMIKSDNTLFTIDLMNRDTYDPQKRLIPRGTVHIFRSIFILGNVCYQRFRLSNFGLEPVAITFSFRYAADFSDMFEIRGMKRKQRGTSLPSEVGTDHVVLSYEGLDGVRRDTRIKFFSTPQIITGTDAHFLTYLRPKRQSAFFLRVSCDSDDNAIPSYSRAYYEVTRAAKDSLADDCHISGSNLQFNDWLERSQSDLHLMLSETADGKYPYAGVPWFNSPFGRDGLITALQSLWVNPKIAKGVLGYLAGTQSTEDLPAQDAEPGKILHEQRRGEMVALGEVPFQKYYGSVDSTPLFLMLASAYYERTGDISFIGRIWEHLETALHWIDTYGDLDGDGFVEYYRRSSNGLENQGWKDSHDSVSHADGTLAEGPIALCEIQGYAFAAKMGMATLYDLRGNADRAHQLRDEAHRLQSHFQSAFWCEEIGTYALALDGKKRPCRVRSSNAGHCLYTGIASPAHAKTLSETLLSETMFSGWGIRTLADCEVRYNPMGYHNGSVWPHDNAIIADGLSRYGYQKEALKIFTGLFGVSRFMDLQRLPELFCGFVYRKGESPTLYPVACSPQAWAAGSVFMLLKACLGFEIYADKAQIRFKHPLLPKEISCLQIEDLEVGKAKVDLLIQRHTHDVGINVIKRTGSIEIINVK